MNENSDDYESETQQCDLCENEAVDYYSPVVNEDTGEMADARLCEDHVDKLERYNAGEEVDWDL